jgi:putative transposase
MLINLSRNSLLISPTLSIEGNGTTSLAFYNEILDWELSDTSDNQLVIRPTKRLLKKKIRIDHPILLHSDQGVQYVSAGYGDLLKEHGILQSMLRAGTPRDNAVIESFFGKFKDTLRVHFRYWEYDNLYDVVAQAIYYFNYIRPIRKLNGKPPVPFRLELTA